MLASGIFLMHTCTYDLRRPLLLASLLPSPHRVALLRLTRGFVARVTSLFTLAYFARIAVCFAIMAPTPIL